jgi:hypothetical protein
VFGVPLLELLVSEKKRKLGIPYIIYATTNHLLTHGMCHRLVAEGSCPLTRSRGPCSLTAAIAEEDLFTQSASSSGLEDLRDAFESLSRGTQPSNEMLLLTPPPRLTYLARHRVWRD